MFKIKKKEIEKINGALHNKHKVKLKEITRKKISISVTVRGCSSEKRDYNCKNAPTNILVLRKLNPKKE